MFDTLTISNPDSIVWKLIREHPIYNGISDEEVRTILPFFSFVPLQAGQAFIDEGMESSRDLYFILKGTLEVIKIVRDEGTPTPDKNREFTLARLTAGDALGELSFITGDPRSASIKSVSSSLLMGLNPMDFTKLEVAYPAICNNMMKNMVGYVGNRLKQSSASEVKAIRVELQNSILNAQAILFFSYVLGLLCVYNLAIHFITSVSVDENHVSLISAGIIVIFGAVLIIMIRQSKLPLSIFGLTRKNWKPAVKESLFWSAIVIVACILVKWILIHYVSRYQHLSLFDFSLTEKKYIAFNFILYGLHSPIQEFVARGVLQGSLQHFFTGKNIAFRAIIASNALFSATHVHLMGGLLGVIVFVPGLFWGWLYSRHDTLIGVSLSHMLIGWTGLFFLNLESLF